jgi:uncharacterized sulfatase
MGDHRGFWRKDTLFEEALRVPLFIAAPGLAQPGTASSSLAELQDLYPTLADLAKLPAVPGIAGKSLSPVLRDPRAAVREAAVSLRQVKPPVVAASVRSGRWRYTQWPDGSEELYDLDAPGRLRKDLAGDPAHADALAEMRALRIESVP